MALYDVQQSTAAVPLMFPLVSATDGQTPLTGATPTVTLSKNGAAFGAPAGAVTEIGSGLYKVAANATDSNTLGILWLHATAAGAAPQDVAYGVVAYNPQDSAALGLSRLDPAVTGLTLARMRMLDALASSWSVSGNVITMQTSDGHTLVWTFSPSIDVPTSCVAVLT